MKLFGNLVLGGMLALCVLLYLVLRSRMASFQNKKNQTATLPVSAEEQSGFQIETSGAQRKMVAQKKRDITIE